MLNKKMKKLGKKFEAADGQPLRQARLLKSGASVQRKIVALEKSP